MITAREKLYLVGIGGMGMAPLAICLKQAGFEVEGHDDNLKEPVRRVLEAEGIQLHSGDDALASGVDRLIISSAISSEHPTVRQALERNLKVVRRGEMLAELAQRKKLIAVVGSHGKTTTAGMLIHALRESGFDFSYVLGALYGDSSVPPARYSEESPWLVAEIDESDGTIAHFSPCITLTVNLDWDHPDQYKSPEELGLAFRRLYERTSGLVLRPHDSSLLDGLTAALDCEVRTFGEDGDYSVSIGEFSAYGLKLILGGLFPYAEIPVAAAGSFNARNAVAALAVLRELGVGTTDPNLLARFPGIRRRQTKLYDDGKLVIFEDYAHHPSEIGALLDLGRSCFPGYRQVVVFQPHRYTRTLQYKREFARVLERAEELILLPVYAASEKILAGGLTEDLQHELKEDHQTVLVRSYLEMREILSSKIAEKTLILFIGAGDIDAWAHEFVENLNLSPQLDDPAWWCSLAGRLSGEAYCSRDESMADKTTFRVGGRARYYVEPADENDLSLVVQSVRNAGIPYFILGRGSNLIVLDEGYDGVVIRLSHSYWKRIEPAQGGKLRVGAGQLLRRICAEAARKGMAGFEFLEGIPGTLGGALRMNAGAMGGWTFDVVEEVTLLTPEGEIKTLGKGDFHVGYRECRELVSAVALSAVLKPTHRESEMDIRARMEEFTGKRKESQPRLASAGCIFKNPEGGHAGQIIDEVGLKGVSVGNAEVSEVHGNFIINTGGAKSADVIALVKQIRARVKEARGIDLEPEVMLLGSDWKEVLS